MTDRLLWKKLSRIRAESSKSSRKIFMLNKRLFIIINPLRQIYGDLLTTTRHSCHDHDDTQKRANGLKCGLKCFLGMTYYLIYISRPIISFQFWLRIRPRERLSYCKL